jgi:hypothetical protein
MERETLLTVLIVLLGGLATQVSSMWPSDARASSSAMRLERTSWLRLWLPLVPALLVAAWLCGWALQEPDPVPEHVSALLFAACAPFAWVCARALARAAWSLVHVPDECGVATVGLICPQIVFSPFLAKRLDERVICAALGHERVHVLHRDPLRIWLGQLAADLQWPSPSARRRFEAWMTALEHARDDEARSNGVAGEDLAAAVLASVRFHQSRGGRVAPCVAQLTGESSALRERVARLLRPLSCPDDPPVGPRGVLLIPAMLVAAALGVVLGERLIGPLLGMAF